MSGLVKIVMCGIALVGALAGCGSSKPSGAEVEVGSSDSTTSMAATHGALPQVDINDARSKAGTDGRVLELTFATTGSRTVKDYVWGTRTTDWVVPVAAGQTMTVTFQASAKNLYLNVVNVADGSVLPSGQTQGPNASVHANKGVVLLLEPRWPQADRGQVDRMPYTLTVTRQ